MLVAQLVVSLIPVCVDPVKIPELNRTARQVRQQKVIAQIQFVGPMTFTTFPLSGDPMTIPELALSKLLGSMKLT